MKGQDILRQGAKWEMKQHDVLRGGKTGLSHGEAPRTGSKQLSGFRKFLELIRFTA